MDDIKKLFLAPIIAAMRELKPQQRQGGSGASSWASGASKNQMALSRYLIQTFEMLIICAQSQHSFTEHLLSQNLAMKELIHEFNQFFEVGGRASISDQYGDADVKQLIRQLGQKIVSLLSIMITERVGQAFLKSLFGLGGQQQRDTSSNILKNIIDSLIVPICVQDGVRPSQLKISQLDLQNKFNSDGDLQDFFAQDKTILEHAN